MHNTGLQELVEKYGYNLITIRHIVRQYAKSGRTGRRKFKKNIHARNAMNSISDDTDSDFEEYGYESDE